MPRSRMNLILAGAAALVLAGTGCTDTFCPDCARHTAVTGLRYTLASTATVGTPITPLAPAVRGGTPTDFTVTAGALPPGLSLDPATGVIAGTPTAPGGFAVTIQAGNSAGAVSEVLTFYEAAPAAAVPAGTDAILTLGYHSPQAFAASLSIPAQVPTVNVAAAQGSPSGVRGGRIAAQDGGRPASSAGATTYAVTAGALPPGLSLGADGAINGTPTAAGAYTFTVTASSGGTTAAETISYQVNPTGSLTLNFPVPTMTLTGSQAGTTPAPVVSNPVSGQAPTFAVTGGTLPPGVTLNADGSLSGTPAGTGSYPFTVTATSGSQTSSFSVLVTIADPPVAASLVPSDASPLHGATVTLTPTFSGGSATLGTSGSGSSDLATAAVSGVVVTTGAVTAPVTFTVTVTNAAGATAATSCAVIPQTVTVATPSPARPVVNAGSTTAFTTTVGGGLLGTVTWSATAGAIDAGTGVWTAPAQPASGVTILATSVDDPGQSAATTVTVAGLPTGTLAASTANPLRGATDVTLTPVFAGAGAVLGTTQGGSQISASVTSGVPVPVQPSGFTAAATYWLRTTSATGSYADASLTVTPQTVTVGALSPAAPTRAVGTPTTFSTTVGGGALGTVTWSASAGSFSPGTSTWTAPAAANPAVTITATSVDDPTRTATTTVNVVSVVADGLVASTSNPLRGATGVTLTPTFSGAVSAVLGTTQGGSQLSASVTSGVPVPVQASGFTTATTYWLRATDAGGAHVDASVAVTPQTVSVGALSPAAPTLTVGSAAAFSTTVTGGALGTVTWSASAGSFSPGTGNWTAPATANPAVTITATSVDDPARSATTSVAVVAAPSASLGASTSSPLFGATNVTVTPVFAGATTVLLGTTPGGSQISSAFASGAAIPVQASGFNGAATYWLRALNAAGSHADASVTVTPQTVSIGAVSPAAATRAVSSATTFSATVAGGALGTVTWSASAGAMVAATGAWTAPATANPSVTITATSVDDPTRTASTTVTVVAAATASLAASTTSPRFGATDVTLTPTFSGAASVTLGTTQGGSQISSSFASGASIPVQASGFTAATSYWLRATSAGGTHTDAVVTVTPQTVSVGALSPAAPTRTASTVTTFSTTVTGGALGTVTWSASAGTMAATTGVWTAPATAGSVTLTATSVDDPTRSATTTATVVLAPSVSLAASTTSPLRGATNVTVTPTFSNATSAVVGTAQGGSQVSLSPTSGQAVAVQPGGFTTAATYWLRGTNAAASYADASVTVTPQTVSVGAVSPAAPAVLINSTTAFSATVTGGALGTVTWTASAGAINAGTGSWTAPSTANPGVTITATSVDDGTKTASTTVTVSATPPPGITSFTGNPTTISAGQGTLLAYTCTNGSGVITDGSGNTVASGLSGSGSKAVSPGATMTYTLTVTGTGTPATATVTITVLDFVSKWLYVADDLDGTVHGFTLDDATGALAAITGSPWSLAGAATTARNVCTDPQARFVFAVDNTSNLVTSFKINQSTGALARVAGYGTDAAPWGATVDPPGKFLYVRCDGKVDVFSINQTSGVLAATTPASYATTSGTGNGGLLTSNNGDIVVHPSGLFLFSAGQSSGKVDVFAVDPATGALSANLAYALLGSSGPIGVAVDPTGAFVAAKGEVAPTSITTWAFDITTGTLSGGNVSGALDGDNAYNGLCFSPTLDVLYCAYYNLNGTQGAFPSVGAFGIDLGTGALSGLTLSPYTWFTEGTFQGSDNIAVSRNGKWAYATDYEGSQIGFGAVDTATGALATSATAYGTGGGPDCIAIAGVLQ